MQLMHLGAYFDPGMEFGSGFNRLSRYKKELLEAEFDLPFRGSGVRIIKSHCFATQIDVLKSYWPESPVVLVHRSNDACLGWWVKCGHFDITYPLYHKYYVDLKTMATKIEEQNQGIVIAETDYASGKRTPATNLELCDMLGIARPENSIQHYQSNDIKVTVI